MVDVLYILGCRGTLAAMVMGGRLMVGLAIEVVVGVPVRGIIHQPVCVHLWPHTMVHPR